MNLLADDTEYHSYKEYDENHRKRKNMNINKTKMGLYLMFSLVITTPIAWGLNRVATTIEDANINDLSANIKSISTDFKYIASINQSLAEIVEDVNQIERKFDIDDIDQILIKLNGTLDELIEILKEFPHPNPNPNKKVFKKIEIISSQLNSNTNLTTQQI